MTITPYSPLHPSEFPHPPPPPSSPWSSSFYSRSLALYNNLQSNPLHKRAVSQIINALRLYAPEGVIVSFNGGKDATVVAALTCAGFAGYYEEVGDIGPPPRGIFFDDDLDFEQVKYFVKEWSDDWGLDLIKFGAGTKFDLGLGSLCYGTSTPPSQKKLSLSTPPPNQIAFVLGTRSTDPNGLDQGEWQPSSSGWMPPFMRCNPLFHWSYAEVWEFLRNYGGGFCGLYSEGYTSLGSVKETEKCPSLLIEGSGGEYRPAWELLDGRKEREGRKKKTDEKPTLPPPPPPLPTVSLLIIGDEILSGYAVDTNTHTCALSFSSVNIPLSLVRIVSDDVNIIAAAVEEMGRDSDVLITSGGLGPTHDDVTIKGICEALKCEPEINKELLEFVTEKSNVETQQYDNDSDGSENSLNSNDSNSKSSPKGLKRRQSLKRASLKMSSLPPARLGTELLYLAGEGEWPTLKCGGFGGMGDIFVLPGVPQFFTSKVKLVAEHLAERYSVEEDCVVGGKDLHAVAVTSSPPSVSPVLAACRQEIILSCPESLISDSLSEAVERYPMIKFGSYPKYRGEKLTVAVTMEARGGGGMNDLDEAKRSLVDELGEYLIK